MPAYGVQAVRSSGFQRERVFGNLSETAVKNVDAIAVVLYYSRRAILYSEAQTCRGIFVVRAGRVKLSTVSADGRVLILRFAGPGDVLGLPESISGEPYAARAVATESSEVNFIGRRDFLRFLSQDGEAARQVIRELSDSYLSLVESVRDIALMPHASMKLARFLLQTYTRNGNGDDTAGIQPKVTHEEIGQILGLSRETVTRLFSDFRKKDLIRFYGSLLVITDSKALKNHAAGAPLKTRGELVNRKCDLTSRACVAPGLPTRSRQCVVV
jgi:CRP/FNR family transcriptional regulator, cyclic AMP receptor protein